jgi:hypothetical protein
MARKRRRTKRGSNAGKRLAEWLNSEQAPASAKKRVADLARDLRILCASAERFRTIEEQLSIRWPLCPEARVFLEESIAACRTKRNWPTFFQEAIKAGVPLALATRQELLLKSIAAGRVNKGSPAPFLQALMDSDIPFKLVTSDGRAFDAGAYTRVDKAFQSYRFRPYINFRRSGESIQEFRAEFVPSICKNRSLIDDWWNARRKKVAGSPKEQEAWMVGELITLAGAGNFSVRECACGCGKWFSGRSGRKCFNATCRNRLNKKPPTDADRAANRARVARYRREKKERESKKRQGSGWRLRAQRQPGY